MDLTVWKFRIFLSLMILHKINLGKCTDLGSLIGNTQCGNFRIWHEINFGHFEPLKLPFWPFEQLWILNFWQLLTFSSVKFVKNVKSEWQQYSVICTLCFFNFSAITYNIFILTNFLHYAKSEHPVWKNKKITTMILFSVNQFRVQFFSKKLIWRIFFEKSCQ